VPRALLVGILCLVALRLFCGRCLLLEGSLRLQDISCFLFESQMPWKPVAMPGVLATSRMLLCLEGSTDPCEATSLTLGLILGLPPFGSHASPTPAPACEGRRSVRLLYKVTTAKSIVMLALLLACFPSSRNTYLGWALLVRAYNASYLGGRSG
jgi:hypothetical protein